MKNSINLFDYELPTELIADKPRPRREDAKLMVYDRSKDDINHSRFSCLSDYFNKGDLLVLNDTKVIPGRLYLNKESGGLVEVLFHKNITDKKIICIFKSSRKLLMNSRLLIDKNNYFTVEKVEQNYVTLSCNNDPMKYFLKYGHVPLPKYIKREATAEDANRYQTIYAKNIGSVAAPTAGLHFTDEVLSDLQKKGVRIEYLTLHVTYNTFKPISVENYENHKIGSEVCFIKDSLISKIISTRDSCNKVYAAGTTTTRALENYASKQYKGDFSGDVDLYITPGHKFKMIDGLITNFHLPKSTLLLLVSSLIGRKKLLNLYNLAIDNDYRFYSYGDSMFIKI
tara:strand:- start:1263 stop:2285 length:1023 start_codon:yes stop_codon:yes gene_type:complete